MADLSDDQHTRLRELASKDVWHPVDAMEAKQALPALLDTIKAQKADLGTWAVRWQEQFERAETAERAITDLTETVRDVAESLGETGSASDSLAAQTLNTACDQAGEG